MEHDEAIDTIGGVEAKSPESARRQPEKYGQKEEKKKAFESLLGRLSKSGPPPKFDLSKATKRPETPLLNLQFMQPSVHSPPTAEISPPQSAHSEKDSGYDTESPVKKLNPAASEFKSAPTPMEGGRKNYPRLKVDTVFGPPQILAPVPMPAGLPPMKPFGMPFDSDRNVKFGGAANYPVRGQGNNNSNNFLPSWLQPPLLDGMPTEMGYPMPPLCPAGPFGNFHCLPPPPNMLSSFPSLASMMLPIEPPMFNNGNHFNTFPHCGPAPSMLAPPMPPTFQVPNNRPLASVGPTTLPQVSIHSNSNATNATVPPPVGAPPHFPVTKKPRDNDPYKQQKYEEYLEWRKMYEPGFHLAAKQRQQTRFQRQRGGPATQSESTAAASNSG